MRRRSAGRFSSSVVSASVASMSMVAMPPPTAASVKADRGLGEGHVDRIQGHEQPGREQAVDAAQHDHGQEVPEAQDGKRHHHQEREQHDVD